MSEQKKKIGFACAYTPLPLIHAAGFEPYRILPVGDAPDQAGSYLHDNLCPHIKRILDRALAGELPALEGVVLVASCDAMRRLADAWRVARPDDRLALIDLPVGRNTGWQGYFEGELERLLGLLREWSGREIAGRDIVDSTHLYNQLAERLEQLRTRLTISTAGPAILQREYVRTVTSPLEESLAGVDALLKKHHDAAPEQGVPVYLFGNLLPEPEAMELFASSGCRVVFDDLCTGSRQLTALEVDNPDLALNQLAGALLNRPVCARTFFADQPGTLAREVLANVKQHGARGVIAHVMKFCDPYLARLPAVREELRDAGIPFLVLEGDCTTHALGQHRTRIEAFAEMLGG
ncbi:MAG: 2-hydroxyacyl-CoA dehydratase [Deltaproteobacteria bacterium]|nr:2-hydroxyacyl-CoA dehydratase [Deltaproteobacteria bacterium]